MNTGWDDATFRRRVADPTAQRRWPGGSPEPAEIAAYMMALPEKHPRGLALILGMTPELRRAALEQFTEVVSIDRSREAHALFADWIPSHLAHRERCILGDWQSLPTNLLGQVDVVFGDGVFGNCHDTDEAESFLGNIRRVLSSNGVLITRHACYPDDFAGMITNREQLIAGYHSGLFDDAEIGFALRLSAFVHLAWDREKCLLNCRDVYRRLDDLRIDGQLPQELFDFSMRYYFNGKNWIPDERRWQDLLRIGGWSHQRYQLVGRQWNTYYPIYRCSR